MVVKTHTNSSIKDHKRQEKQLHVLDKTRAVWIDCLDEFTDAALATEGGELFHCLIQTVVHGIPPYLFAD